MPKKPIYELTVGIDFEGRKPAVRLERGDLLPSWVSQKEIDEMLACVPPLLRELNPEHSDGYVYNGETSHPGLDTFRSSTKLKGGR